jgi:hypothetical protein
VLNFEALLSSLSACQKKEGREKLSICKKERGWGTLPAASLSLEMDQ